MLDGFQKQELNEQLKIMVDHAKEASVKIEDYDRYQGLTNLTIGEDSQMRQWNYQFCNEFGWFQIPSPISESHQMRSQLLGLDYWYELCQDLFGREIGNSRHNNMRSIGNMNRNGRVIYVNSIEDPWLGVSVLPKDKPDQLWFLDQLGGPKFIE